MGSEWPAGDEMVLKLSCPLIYFFVSIHSELKPPCFGNHWSLVMH